jgi:hypothetical protein
VVRVGYEIGAYDIGLAFWYVGPPCHPDESFPRYESVKVLIRVKSSSSLAISVDGPVVVGGTTVVTSDRDLSREYLGSEVSQCTVFFSLLGTGVVIDKEEDGLSIVPAEPSEVVEEAAAAEVPTGP